MTDALRTALQSYIQQHLYPHAVVTELNPISDGWETEAYRLTLENAGTPQKLILRMYPGEDAVAKCPHEFRTLKTLHTMGYPVPEVRYHTTDAHITGKPFLLMQFIDGQPLGKRLASEPPEYQAVMFQRYIELMVQLHQLDVYQFLPEDTPKSDLHDPSYAIRSKLRYFQTMLDRFQRPEFQPLMAWLDSQRGAVPCPRLSIIHYDFHPFNILVTADDRAYVIDWGTAEAADYRLDLGWSMMLAGSYRGEGQRSAILSGYESAAGKAVERIDIFEVMAALRRLCSVRISMSAGADALGMRPEAAAIMRQQGEHLRAVYGIITRHTGLRLPDIERWLESL